MVDKNGKQLTNSEVIKKSWTRLLSYFLDFELMLLNFIGSIPLHVVRRFFYRLAGIKIGRSSTIHCWVRFYDPKKIKIGDGTIIGDHCFLDGRDKLLIGNNVDIASQVLIYNSEHDINSVDFKPITAPVIIEDHVFIGPRAIILPGVKIGQGAAVAAGAVVSRDIPEYKIYGGVPAREIGERRAKDLHYKLGRFKLFQ